MTLAMAHIARTLLAELEPRDLRRLAELVHQEGVDRGWPYNWWRDTSMYYERGARSYGDST